MTWKEVCASAWLKFDASCWMVPVVTASTFRHQHHLLRRHQLTGYMRGRCCMVHEFVVMAASNAHTHFSFTIDIPQHEITLCAPSITGSPECVTKQTGNGIGRRV